MYILGHCGMFVACVAITLTNFSRGLWPQHSDKANRGDPCAEQLVLGLYPEKQRVDVDSGRERKETTK